MIAALIILLKCVCYFCAIAFFMATGRLLAEKPRNNEAVLVAFVLGVILFITGLVL